MKKVSFHRLAETELREAARHYDEQTQGLGEQLLEEVEIAVSFLLDFPEAAEQVSGVIRRFVLRRFPYSLMYRPLPRGRIRILAVAHHKRRPRYWVERR